MTTNILPSDRAPLMQKPAFWLALLAAFALACTAALVAQVAGDRGIAPVASSTDIEVHGIEVNVTGKNAEDARRNGWLEAQRLAWKKIDGPDIPDSRLEGLVSAIIVEEENIGPRRYIAKLGVIFDRQRAGGLLGGEGARSRSAPMLTLPVMVSGGTETMFETRNAWQQAWAEFQAGGSTIDYVRPQGSGGESLLLTYGQTQRRSRAWWNTILDQFSAADVLVPIADLDWSYPGGPVEGTFIARYGPDNRFLGSFKLRVNNSRQLPAMLSQAVVRLDAMFQKALADGTLRPDPTLSLDNVEISAEVRALLEASRQAEAAEQRARAGAADTSPTDTPGTAPSPIPTEPTQTIGTYAVQMATADAQSYDNALAVLRGTAGVRSVVVNSTAVGGTSVLQVTYAGDLDALAAALRGSGWRVAQGPGGLGISR